MPSQRVVQLCNSQETVTRAQAERPKTPVKHNRKRIFGSGKPGAKTEKKVADVEKEDGSWKSAEKCGQFPYTPSELFLKVSYLAWVCRTRVSSASPDGRTRCARRALAPAVTSECSPCPDGLIARVLV